ncbi:MAG: hypothetical protein R3F48_03705 [Candidatus Zixiibacteriota bacterium]
MKTRMYTIAAAALAMGLALFLIGCSSDERGDVSDPVTEEIVSQLVEHSVLAKDSQAVDVAYAQEDTMIEDDAVEEPIEDEAPIPVTPLIKDMLLKDGIVYSLYDNGVAMHTLATGVNNFIPSPETLGAMVDLGDKIVVGGENLYTIDGGYLSGEDFDLELDGPITALEKHGAKLMVGTTNGFYQVDIDGIRELAKDINVTHIASSEMGVWVGTAGEGLYYYNGDSFRKRYLQRDPSLFDNVTALQHHYNHLYLGTDNGLFVYDGGRWQPFGLADGLPSENITAINADEWVVKIGTDRGAVTLFNNEFKPIGKFEGMIVTDFVNDGRKLIAATTTGVYMKSGDLLATLFDESMHAPAIAFEEPF